VVAFEILSPDSGQTLAQALASASAIAA